MECVHVTVTGSGSATLPAGVSFPGAYSATDKGVLFNIYSSFSSYPGVGPAVAKLGGSSGSSPAAPATTPKPAATSAAAAATTLATVAKPAETPASGSGAATAQKYAQCGGQGYSGATACASGSTCTKQNDYYSQCI
jgi:cellulase